MSFLAQLILFTGGHAAGALLFYFFHRVIFHGPLAKYPVFKQWAAIHTRHHGTPGDPGSFFFPWWANAAIGVFTVTVFFLTPAFSLGMVSFFALYAYRHRAAHNGSTAHWAQHHQSHHFAKPRANFSGSYPFVDKLFGTYVPVDFEVFQARAARARVGNTKQRGKIDSGC